MQIHKRTASEITFDTVNTLVPSTLYAYMRKTGLYSTARVYSSPARTLRNRISILRRTINQVIYRCEFVSNNSFSTLETSKIHTLLDKTLPTRYTVMGHLQKKRNGMA